MGTMYFLVRDDTRELYELGKAYAWRKAFETDAGLSAGVTFTPGHALSLELALELMSRQAGWIIDEPDKYFAQVAQDIIRGADGQRVMFIAEFDRRIEHDGKCRITGSRFKLPGKLIY